ncbi:MAG: helicase-related protein [Thermomicrobiales bacterium]
MFANARSTVETYADLLKQMSDKVKVMNEFLPHHGNLARDLREAVEAKLKASESPTTAICTSTLEMGIDIGTVDSVAQIGPPPSVASLRQRLGRSGRRGDPAVLRVYVSELEIDHKTQPADQLRVSLVQAVAMMDLVLEKWFELPNVSSLHLSTLIQQVLSIIAQHGGATARELYRTLCERGPFGNVSQAMFTRLLRDLGTADVLIQADDSTLLPGLVGEPILNHYSFYAAFQTAIEYRLMADGPTLGTIPIDFPILRDSMLVFAGRRWRVLDVDEVSRVILLAPASGGNPPMFAGTGADVADEVRLRMRRTLESSAVPVYLDSAGRGLLAEGRANYARLRLADIRLLGSGRKTIVFPWRGDRVMNTLMVLLLGQGVKATDDRLTLTCTDADPALIRGVMEALVADPELPGTDLARHVLIKRRDKYDHFLGGQLLNEAYAARDLDIPGAYKAMREILQSGVDAG